MEWKKAFYEHWLIYPEVGVAIMPDWQMGKKWIFTVQFQYHKTKSTVDILVRHNCKYCYSLSSLLLPSLIHLFTHHAFNTYLLSAMVGTKNINLSKVY